MALTACGDVAKLNISEGQGAIPTLPVPVTSLIPTVNIAVKKCWGPNRPPVPAAGLSVTAFARDLDHPRGLYVLPNGDILVAETNAPPRPKAGKNLKGWKMRRVMQRAGAGVPSANRITLLRARENPNSAAFRSEFLSGLNSPFGLSLVGADLYVANTDAVVRYHYETGDTRISDSGFKLVNLPAAPIDRHWTKNLIASLDGSKLYVTVGSNSNASENGMQAEAVRAAIWEVDLKTGAHRIFASGLPNPNGLAWEPVSRGLWTADNELDELGSDLVPDNITSVKDGGFYGWPYRYCGAFVDERAKPPRAGLVASLRSCDALPGAFENGMFVGQQGSWNRKPRSGYKLIFVPFFEGRPVAKPVDVLTGFVNADGKALGRPVGVAIDSHGALLVADDVGNVIWRVSKSASLGSRTQKSTGRFAELGLVSGRTK